MTMTERIEVHKMVKMGKTKPYTVDEVLCPKIDQMQAAQRCKQCHHCRIYLGTHVKCTYADDKRRKELRTETIV